MRSLRSCYFASVFVDFFFFLFTFVWFDSDRKGYWHSNLICSMDGWMDINRWWLIGSALDLNTDHIIFESNLSCLSWISMNPCLMVINQIMRRSTSVNNTNIVHIRWWTWIHWVINTYFDLCRRILSCTGWRAYYN